MGDKPEYKWEAITLEKNADFQVIDTKGKVWHSEARSMYFDETTKHFMCRVQKNYWAVGRKVKIRTTGEIALLVPPGDYEIHKRDDLGYQDNLIFKLHVPPSMSARQTLKWMEARIAVLEAQDGLTVDKFAAKLGL